MFLLSGDHSLAWNEYDKIRKSVFGGSVFGDRLKTFSLGKKDDGGYTFREVMDALEICGFDDNPRLVALFGVPNQKEFRSGLEAIIPQIDAPHYLVIIDTAGTIDGANWRGVIDQVRSVGKYVLLDRPLDKMYKSEQIPSVMDMGRTSGVGLTTETATILLDLLGPDRACIQSALDGLLEMGLTQPDSAQLRQVVVPFTVDYPVYLFYSAFNTGQFTKILEAARSLRANKYPADIVLGFAVKQCRWQLLGAELMARGKDVATSLRNLGGPKNEQEVSKRLLVYRPDRRYFHPVTDETAPKREMLTSEPMIRDIARFVESIIPRACPAAETDRPKWIVRKCTQRFLLAYDAMVSQREALDNNEFEITLRELSV